MIVLKIFDLNGMKKKKPEMDVYDVAVLSWCSDAWPAGVLGVCHYTGPSVTA